MGSVFFSSVWSVCATDYFDREKEYFCVMCQGRCGLFYFKFKMFEITFLIIFVIN